MPTATTAVSAADQPIGVFDSGVGGLSILRTLLAELPQERFVYFADTGHAPYGERGDAHVIARSRAVTHALIEQHQIKALVVACNTATAAAIHLLRAEWPTLPFIGVEPALKPAVAASRTGHIAVLATRGTLASDKFNRLRQGLAAHAQFHCVPCDGLADAIEHADATRTAALCAHYMHAAGPFGSEASTIDTVVLGCTHYPFAMAWLRAQAPATVQFLDTGAPVAQHTRRVLATAQLLQSTTDSVAAHTAQPLDRVRLQSSADLRLLEQAAARWLPAQRVRIDEDAQSILTSAPAVLKDTEAAHACGRANASNP